MMADAIRLPQGKSDAATKLSAVLGTFMPRRARNTVDAWGGQRGSSSSTGVQENTRRKARHFGVIEEGNGEAGVRKLIWTKELECGIREIDAQHRNLFDAGNKLLEAIDLNASESLVTMRLQVLFKRIMYHFRSEELLLARWKHPLTEDHRNLHQDLLAKTDGLLVRLRSGNLSDQCVISFLIDDLVCAHIASEDCKFLFPK